MTGKIEDAGHWDVTLHETLPAGVSPALYNQDLAPTKKEGRTWSAYNIFALWANDVHSLGNYSFAIGLFALGLGAWQILAALGFGAAFLFVLLHPVRLHGHQDRRAVPGDEPDQLRHPGRADPGADPRRRGHRLVRHPDLPGLAGAATSC